jgi:Flp pilus assembly protein TadG
MIALRRALGRSSLRRDRSAATAVEFAAISVVLLTIVVILIEASVQLLTHSLLEYGVREASRFGVTGQAVPSSMSANPPVSREAAITDIIAGCGLGLIKLANLTVTVTTYPNFNNGAKGTAGAGGPGAIVRYQAIYTEPFLTSVAAAITGMPAIQHTVTMFVQNEPFPSS